MNLLVETEVDCPHCGEMWLLTVDTSQAHSQIIEDCTVCCRPIEFTFDSEPGEVLAVHSTPA